ncbi:MAG TPA: 16S rRNA (guanine(527)-N(7))-methyltransferase RsmG [Candidatus Baltobacteraceae bacterium]
MSDVASALARHGAPPEALERLARYGELLLERNREFNLTGARNANAVAEHIADALTLLPFIAADGELIDVGSGGGLPGIPLAIVSGISLCAIDATAKKVAFISDAMVQLEISGEAIAARAENLAQEQRFREKFMYATARALASAAAVVELTLPFLAIRGRALLQRGTLSDSERSAAREVALALGGEISDELPLEGERRILVVTKRFPTPLRFPRRVGIAQRRPLSS